jgi:tetratricopeptide (TPR) repeat protein
MTEKINSMSSIQLVAFLSIFLFSGCAALEIRRPVSIMDTPEHHYANGMKLYERGQYEKAVQSFIMAGELDPEFAPAYVGYALIEAHKKDYNKAHQDLDAALSNANSAEHKTLVQIGRIRVASEERAGDNWIGNAEDYYDAGLGYSEKSPQLHYYMGMAYKQAYQFDKAADMFKAVLELNGDFMVEADHEWSQVQKIQQAAPESTTGKQIALIDKIDRADTAALLIHELKLDKLYKKRGANTSDVSYKGQDGTELKVKNNVQVPTEDVSYKGSNGTELKVKDNEEVAIERVNYKGPDGIEIKVKRTVEVATDIKNHVLAADIAEAVRLDIRGLKLFPDHTFRPDMPITRAEFAVMVEDIILKVTGYERQTTQFLNSTSPLPDVRSDFWAYNAIVFATTKGIMEVKDIFSGEFQAHSTLSGADALLIIRKIKDELKFF